MNIPVVYEDQWLLIAEKPAGLLTIPSPRKEKRTLVNLLNSELSSKNAAYRLHPCHRLDRDTSGLIILAKGKTAQKRMMEVFRKRQVKKKYLAFVHGSLGRDSGSIDVRIEGKTALTEFKVIQRFGDFTVVEAYPLTGRKNQIRLHFKSIGHPLVGEDRFIFRRDYKLRAKRICLHATSLEFRHPYSAKYIKVNSPPPDDLKNFLCKAKTEGK